MSPMILMAFCAADVLAAEIESLVSVRPATSMGSQPACNASDSEEALNQRSAERRIGTASRDLGRRLG